MADSKITALTALTAADPANDMLPVVDVSDTSMAASGTTKRISINNLLACSPSATLASATITGDLTVDTSTLKVDSANNRVGIGTASPTSDLDIFRASGSGITSGISLRTAAGAGGDGSFIKWLAGGTNEKVAQIDGVLNGTDVGYLSFLCGNGADAMAEQYRVASSGLFTWFDGAGGTRMTLNSTGLGIGAGPGLSGGSRRALTVNAPTGQLSILEFAVNSSITATLFSNTTQTTLASAGSTFFSVETNAVERMRIDSSGNVGIGVTPSYKLHVSGRISYTGTIGEGADATLSSSGTALLHGNAAAWTSQTFYTGGTSRVVVKQNGQVRFVPLAADPASPEAGDVYYNSTSNKLKCYNGTIWNDLF